MVAPSVIAASKIELAEHTRQSIRTFNRLAGKDHKKFRIMVNKYFHPGRKVRV